MTKQKQTKQNQRNRQTERRQSSASQIIEIEEAQKRRKAKRAEYMKQDKVQKRREKILEKANRPKMSSGKKFAVCGVLIVAAFVFLTSGYRIVNLNLDKTTYERKYEEKLAEKARLEKELSLVDDPDYIAQQARDRFHMLRDGEILYVFNDQEGPEVQ